MEPGDLAQLMRRIEAAFLFGVDGVTELWLIRHADCYADMTDVLDPPLSQLGSRQAERVGKRAREAGITEVYSSPSRRAVETARAITETVNIDPRLVEMENNPGEAAKVVMSRYQAFTESPEQVVKRMTEVIDEAVAAHTGERIAIVGHGVSQLAYLGSLMRIEFGQLRLFPYYTCVSIVHALGDRRMVASLFDFAHVADLIGAQAPD